MRMKAKTSNTDFWRFFEMRIATIENECRWGTARNYVKTERSFRSFYGQRDLRLSDITAELIGDYNRYLYGRGLIRNSVSQYNRVLRAVYNEAVRQDLVDDTRPFRRVYTGIDKTDKRTISEREIAKVASSQVAGFLEFARDLFIFSYVTCGMPFVDMAYLKKSSIKDGTLTYYRKKTGSRIQIRLSAIATRIIRKYAAKTRGSQYVFPILGERTGKDAYLRAVSALTEYNRSLKKLSRMSGLSRRLTSYVSRHSWATAARNNGARISVISEALGHQSERMTRVYLDSFDDMQVYEINKRLVNKLKLFGFL